MVKIPIGLRDKRYTYLGAKLSNMETALEEHDFEFERRGGVLEFHTKCYDVTCDSRVAEITRRIGWRTEAEKHVIKELYSEYFEPFPLVVMDAMPGLDADYVTCGWLIAVMAGLGVGLWLAMGAP